MVGAENFRRICCSVEWVETHTLVDIAQLALESGISPVWAETYSKIVWNLLNDRDHRFNEITPLISNFKTSLHN